jgi:hypothetical protein
MKTKFIEATLMPEVDKYHLDLRIKRKTKKKKKKNLREALGSVQNHCMRKSNYLAFRCT